MRYVLITTKDEVMFITEQEFKNLAGKAGVVYIPSINEMVNLSFTYMVMAEDKYNQLKKGKKSKMTEGRLHDGSRVVKKFGQWVDAINPGVKIDPHYYPEIASDDVLSEEEWQDRLNQKRLA